MPGFPPEYSVTYGPWEDDPESAYEDVYHVPVSGSFLFGFTTKEVRVPRFRRQRRDVTEVWRYRAWREPVVSELKVGEEATELTINTIDHPPLTEGRRHYEYRSKDAHD